MKPHNMRDPSPTPQHHLIHARQILSACNAEDYQHVSTDASKAARVNLPECSTNLITLAQLAKAKFTSDSVLNSIRIGRFEGEPMFLKYVSQSSDHAQKRLQHASGIC